MTRRRGILPSRRRWSEREVELLRDMYPHERTTDVAARLGTSLSRVYAKANQLGLHKTPEYLDSPAACRLRRGDKVGASHRFATGHVPFNKGVKGWQAGGRARDTQFKKGHFPHNRDREFYVLGALHVNADGYIVMRTSFRPGALGWTALHRALWEDKHGPIPSGHSLCFKDGDKLNVELDNLELISRAELMRRNTIHRLPQALRLTINALGALKRQVRERSNRKATT